MDLRDALPRHKGPSPAQASPCPTYSTAATVSWTDGARGAWPQDGRRQVCGGRGVGQSVGRAVAGRGGGRRGMVAGAASTLAAGLSLGRTVTPPPLQHRATAPLATAARAARFLSLSLREAEVGTPQRVTLLSPSNPVSQPMSPEAWAGLPCGEANGIQAPGAARGGPRDQQPEGGPHGRSLFPHLEPEFKTTP